MSRSVGLMDVKQALRDERFRKTLPIEMKEDLQKYLQNPGCACNVPFYKRVMSEAKSQLQDYFPNRNIANLDEEVKKIAENNFIVINCDIENLEEHLKKLPSGRKQIAMARYENKVTVVINEIDIVY